MSRACTHVELHEGCAVARACARERTCRVPREGSVEHPIAGDELRAIKRYLATRTDQLPWLFLSERGQPLTRSSVQYLVRVAGESTGLQGVPAAASKGRGNSSLAEAGLMCAPARWPRRSTLLWPRADFHRSTPATWLAEAACVPVPAVFGGRLMVPRARSVH